MNLKYRKWIGNISQLLFSQYSHCGYCGRTWNVCQYHSTEYNQGRGCFPLCEDCWKELTPEKRLHYYKMLINDWIRSDPINWDEYMHDWKLIQIAVMDGK